MTSEEVEGWWTHGAAQMHKCGDGHVSHSISVEPREVRELRERVDGLERRIEALENPDNLSSLDVRNVGEGSIQKLKEHGIVTKEDARSQEDRVAEIIGRGRATSLMRALSE